MTDYGSAPIKNFNEAYRSNDGHNKPYGSASTGFRQAIGPVNMSSQGPYPRDLPSHAPISSLASIPPPRYQTQRVFNPAQQQQEQQQHPSQQQHPQLQEYFARLNNTQNTANLHENRAIAISPSVPYNPDRISGKRPLDS